RSSVLGLLDRAHSRAGRVEIELGAVFDSNDAIRVEAGIGAMSRGLGSKPLELWVAVVESELTTPVGRGENASKTLRNDRVVRCLERIPESDAAVRIPLEEEWRRDRLSVAAFLQDMKTLRVYGAAEVPLAR
ncbi:MAG: DUF1223 domain-containing protein, partial [Acidimicrobiia bacterium]|nr:DUF1223 domain-containing protein [Acidimicrobiia bacterium]